MADRRALIIGSWLAKGRDRPTPQKVKSLTDRWARVFKIGRYGFRSLTDEHALPVPVHNPTLSELVAHFEHAQSVSDETELLFYFLGHSTALGPDDLRLTIGTSDKGEDRHWNLSSLLDLLHNTTPIRRLVIILDTCHAGRTRDAFRATQFDYLAMLATGSAYAFDAHFSEGLLGALEESLRKNDQRIDRRAGGVTYRKIFEAARNYVISKPSSAVPPQDPMCFGEYTGDLLLEAPVSVPEGFHPFASDRSIYGRVFRLLEIIRDSKDLDFQRLQVIVGTDRAFLLRRDEDDGDRFLSSERLEDYLDFLRCVEWIAKPSGYYQITERGHRASDKTCFNRTLLDAIEQDVFPENLNLDVLDEIVSELLADNLPPTPIKIKERAGMKGIAFKLTAATRIALQVLPSTGRFLKGSADAIFPSELGDG
jgi:hypothetical protein